MSVWLMAQVCVLPPNEQRVLFVNLHVIPGVKEINGNLMMIPDMDHLRQDPGRCRWGALPGELHVHPTAGNLGLVLTSALGAKHLTPLPQEPRGALLSRLAQNILTPAAEIWERCFANIAEHRICSARKKSIRQNIHVLLQKGAGIQSWLCH